ncbi:RNA polymerase subunit sigma-24 [Verrucomicrobia bacterium LW23]|nr:RNA polymerase subunit sigma-24 [Verrucomicrobia bacterium LW23]
MSSPPPRLPPGSNEAEPGAGQTGPPDDELVSRTQAGDPSAFDELVVRHQRRVYKVIFNMTHNHEDTNDLLMETFTRAYQGIHSYKEQAAFYTWLYRIAVNRTLNFLQKRKHDFHNVSMDDEETNLHERHEFIDPSQKSVTEQERLKLLQKKLNESLMKLSEEHRAVVTLFDIENFSHAEIARIVGVSEGTVRSRLHYAHKQLQKLLKNFL